MKSADCFLAVFALDLLARRDVLRAPLIPIKSSMQHGSIYPYFSQLDLKFFFGHIFGFLLVCRVRLNQVRQALSCWSCRPDHV